MYGFKSISIVFIRDSVNAKYLHTNKVDTNAKGNEIDLPQPFPDQTSHQTESESDEIISYL